MATTQAFVKSIDAWHVIYPLLGEANVERILDLLPTSVASLIETDTVHLCQQPEISTIKVERTEVQPLVVNARVAQMLVRGEIQVLERPCASCVLKARDGQCVVAPLQNGAADLGVLCTQRSTSDPLEPAEAMAYLLFLRAISTALGNARQNEASFQQATERAVSAESKRIASDLHDSVAQSLSLLNLKIDQVEFAISDQESALADQAVSDLKRVANSVYEELRTFLTRLYVGQTQKLDLMAEIRSMVEDFQGYMEAEIELSFDDLGGRTLPPQACTQIVHVIHEALSNVRRHAQATRVSVRVEERDGDIQFLVEDDGQGFDINAVDWNQHFGLSIMRTRVARSGGHLRLDTEPGIGTRIAVSFPITEWQASAHPPTDE